MVNPIADRSFQARRRTVQQREQQSPKCSGVFGPGGNKYTVLLMDLVVNTDVITSFNPSAALAQAKRDG
jgi:hypothetical protein